jgi:hypothetical protein
MHMLKSALLFLLLLIASNLTLASNTQPEPNHSTRGSIEARYSREIEERYDIFILKKLKASGLDQIQGRPIDEIIERAQNARLVISADQPVQYVNPDGTLREGARYEIDAAGQQSIFYSLNEARKSLGNDSRRGVQLHESLGPTDQNFVPSSLLREAEKRGVDYRSLPIDKLKSLMNTPQRGGTSSVGGGGSYGLELHIDWLMYLLFKRVARRTISLDQALDIACFMTRFIDFDLRSDIPPGQFKSDFQIESNGTLRLKIFLSRSVAQDSYRPDLYEKEFDQNYYLYLALLNLFFQSSSNACAL